MRDLYRKTIQQKKNRESRVDDEIIQKDSTTDAEGMKVGITRVIRFTSTTIVDFKICKGMMRVA